MFLFLINIVLIKIIIDTNGIVTYHDKSLEKTHLFRDYFDQQQFLPLISTKHSKKHFLAFS